MAILKSKDIMKMAVTEMEEKIKELRNELIKAKASGKKNSKTDPKELRKTIARLLTIQKIKNKEAKK
jgi:ribosomal protein L29